MEEEEDKFLKENPIIFKKYKVKKKLGEGAFGEVYLGQAIENNAYVALKVEPRKIAKPILESEAFLLYSIAGLGIPEVKSFGKVKNYTVLVEPLLGKSLFDIYAENHKEMPMEDICLIGKQVIDRIQWVHSKFIVHRDIKPDNFLIGKKDPNVIYIIDFGLSKNYRSSTTNKHIRFGFTGKLTGTVRFASANALRGGEQSRRDDIESIGYMLVYFMKKRLPWQGVTGTRKMERYLKIYKMKKNTTPEELCAGLPPEMTEYIKYAKKLEFEQQPDYKYLRSLFGKMLKRIHNTNDQLIFSWIKLTDLPNLKNPINPASRKDSPQSRIYKKIKSSLERERNLSSDSGDSKPGSYQQVFTQGNIPATNLKVIDKNGNFADSEFEQKTDKKLNKKLLKAREGLNTMIANLDVTVDENVVDFENERLKRGSKDFGDYTINSNNTDNTHMNINKIMSNNNNISSSNKNINNNNFKSNNLNLKNNRDSMQNNLDDNKNFNLDVNNPLNNNNINNSHKINLNNNMENNLFDNNSIKNNINDLNNNPINSINNPLNNINPTNNSNNINNNSNILKDNKDIKKSNLLKSSTFDGKEFTFSEPIDFKSKLNFDKKSKEIKEENKEDCKNENKDLNDEEKNNIYALLTGNNQYINNNIKENNNLINDYNNQKNNEIKNNVIKGNVNNMNNINNRNMMDNMDSIENRNNMNIMDNMNITDNMNNINNMIKIDNRNNRNNMNNINNMIKMKNMNNMNNKKNNNINMEKMKEMLYKNKINKKLVNNKNNLNNRDFNSEKLRMIYNEPNDFNNNFNKKNSKESNNYINDNFNNLNNKNDIKQNNNEMNNNNYIKRNSKKMNEINFPNDNEPDNLDDNLITDNIEKNMDEPKINPKYPNNKNMNNNEFSNPYNNNLKNNLINNKKINMNKQMKKKNLNIKQLNDNMNNLNLIPEDGQMENNNLTNQQNLNQNHNQNMNYKKIDMKKIPPNNNRQMNRKDMIKMMNKNNNNLININKIEPQEFSLNSNERDLKKLYMNNMNNPNMNNEMKNKNQHNNTMNVVGNNNMIKMNKGMRISPRNNQNAKFVKKLNPNLNNIYNNSVQYQTYQFNDNNISNNFNNNMKNLNININTDLNNMQNPQFLPNKKMKINPGYMANNNTPKYVNNVVNYQNIPRKLQADNANIRNPKYEFINPSQIRNNKVNNMTGNMGVQYSNTIENKYNNYNNIKFGVGNNQLYNYPNSHNY